MSNGDFEQTGGIGAAAISQRQDKVNQAIFNTVGHDGLKHLHGYEEARIQVRKLLDAHGWDLQNDVLKQALSETLMPLVPYLNGKTVAEDLKRVCPAISDDQSKAIEILESIYAAKAGITTVPTGDPDFISFVHKISLQIKYGEPSVFKLTELGLDGEQIQQVVSRANFEDNITLLNDLGIPYHIQAGLRDEVGSLQNALNLEAAMAPLRNERRLDDAAFRVLGLNEGQITLVRQNAESEGLINEPAVEAAPVVLNGGGGEEPDNKVGNKEYRHRISHHVQERGATPV